MDGRGTELVDEVMLTVGMRYSWVGGREEPSCLEVEMCGRECERRSELVDVV